MKQKKLRFSATLALCMLFGLVVQATTTTFTLTSSSATLEQNGITLSGGSKSNDGYNFNKTTLTVTSTSADITNIVITYVSSRTGGTVTTNPTNTYSLTDHVGTWTGNATTSVTFTTTANARAISIVVTTVESGKTATSLTFSSTTASATISTGADFTEPTLTLSPTTITGITYAITSNGTGSTINSSTGVVTIGTTAGTETVTASYAGDNTYSSSSATYTITVSDPSAAATSPSLTVSAGEDYTSTTDYLNYTFNTTSSTVSVKVGGTKGTYVYYTTDGTTPSTTNGMLLDASSKDKATSAIKVNSSQSGMTIKAIAYTDKSGSNPSAVKTWTFKYLTATAPTLTASAYFITDTYTYTITVPTGETVYYTIDGTTPSTTNGTQLSTVGDNQITFTPNGTKSITVSAVAYNSALASDVVTATYTQGIEPPTISPDGGYKSGTTSYTVTITVPDGSTVYYTTDGTDPTTSSTSGTSDITFTVNTLTTVKAFAVKDSKTSDIVSETYVIEDEKTYVMASTDTEANAGDSRIVYKSGSTTEPLVTMTFGGSSDNDRDNAWAKLNKATSNDNFIGLDGMITDGIILNNQNDAMNELATVASDGKATDGDYKHENGTGTYTKSYQKTFNLLPAYGNYFMFEPQANGTLVIYAEQQGSMYYKDGVFTSTLMRKRPVYLLDETAKCITASAAVTTSRVKADWSKISRESLVGDNLMTQAQAQHMYDLNAAWITANHLTPGSASSPYQNVITLHHSSETNAIDPSQGNYNDAVKTALNTVNADASTDGDQIYDNTGYMLISEGYVRYEFPVVAGKTYFFFGYKTKVGVCAFALKPDANYDTSKGTAFEFAEGALKGSSDNYAPENTTINSTALGKTVGTQYDITVNRTFTAGKWYSLVLPFSIGPAHIKGVFGDGTMVLHFDHKKGVTGSVLNLQKHFQQMTTANVPVLIKPANTVENPIFTNVTLTTPTVEDIEVGSYKMTGSYEPAMMPAYSYFMTNTTVDGVLKSQFSQYNSTESHGIKALRSWLTPTTTSVSAKRLVYAIDGVIEDDETTGISEALVDENDSTAVNGSIYNINGQQVRPSGSSMEGLPKGIYIVNGKKHVVR